MLKKNKTYIEDSFYGGIMVEKTGKLSRKDRRILRKEYEFFKPIYRSLKSEKLAE